MFPRTPPRFVTRTMATTFAAVGSRAARKSALVAFSRP
jgi:hypothetical protein